MNAVARPRAGIPSPPSCIRSFMSMTCIDRKYWSHLTIFEQMGNIGSEVSRALSACGNGSPRRQERAAARAHDLFDATIGHLEGAAPHRAREVRLARQEFDRVLACGPSGDFLQEAAALMRYFDWFAYAARSQHEASLGRNRAAR